jgi:hypothetical protein
MLFPVPFPWPIPARITRGWEGTAWRFWFGCLNDRISVTVTVAVKTETQTRKLETLLDCGSLFRVYILCLGSQIWEMLCIGRQNTCFATHPHPVVGLNAFYFSRYKWKCHGHGHGHGRCIKACQKNAVLCLNLWTTAEASDHWPFFPWPWRLGTFVAKQLACGLTWSAQAYQDYLSEHPHTRAGSQKSWINRPWNEPSHHWKEERFMFARQFSTWASAAAHEASIRSSVCMPRSSLIERFERSRWLWSSMYISSL